MTRRFFLFTAAVFIATAHIATAQVEAPRIGYIVDRAGALRPVNGVTGAFTLGPALAGDIVSAAFSGKCLVVKTAGELKVDDHAFEAPSGPAIVTFDEKRRLKEVFFPEAGMQWVWRGGRFDEFAAANSNTVKAVIYEGRLHVRGVPVHLPSRAERVSDLGEDWLVVYAEDRTFAVRGEQVFELPEDSE